MRVKEKETTAKQLKDKIIEGIQNKRGRKVVSLDISNIENSISDYFVICHGTSNTHVDAIVDSVIETVNKDMQEKPFSKEGLENLTWVLLDYSDVVVHVFQDEYRSFYNLEDLWADAQIERYEDTEI